jgi:hypothetical protein
MIQNVQKIYHSYKKDEEICPSMRWTLRSSVFYTSLPQDAQTFASFGIVDKQCGQRFPETIATIKASGPKINPRINHVKEFPPLFSAANAHPTANTGHAVNPVVRYSIVNSFGYLEI